MSSAPQKRQNMITKKVKKAAKANIGMMQSPGERKPEGLFSYQSADDKDLYGIINLIREGIPYKDFNRMTDYLPFSFSEWARFLQISERTLQRNQKEKKSFQPTQSEKIVELSMLYQFGVDVFGDKDSFDTWLNSKSNSLGGEVPKELLDTRFGISLVKDELGRILHGVLA